MEKRLRIFRHGSLKVNNLGFIELCSKQHFVEYMCTTLGPNIKAVCKQIDIRQWFGSVCLIYVSVKFSQVAYEA